MSCFSLSSSAARSGSGELALIDQMKFHFGFPFPDFWPLRIAENLKTARLHRRIPSRANIQKAQAGTRLWRLAQNLPPRMRRANTLHSKLLSKKSCLSRTRLSRRNLTPRSERGDSGRNGLPTALPAQRIRKPFLPPCQSPLQRLTASPRSAIKLTRNAVHRLVCFRSRLFGD